MDFERYYGTPGINNRSSLAELQEQCEYTLDVDVQKGEKLTGGFGKTFYKAEWIDREESPIVLIEIKGSKVSQEVFLYISLNHPHIIKTYGLVDPNDHIIDPDSILLLQEFAESGDLGGMLLNQYFVPQQNALLEIFIQVADAMIFLSKNGIVHGDLACRNVLVFKSHPSEPKKNLVKLIDFGSTQNISKSSDTKIEFPARYVPQEVISSKGQSGYSEKSDVYAFAVFMWEACSFGKMPYEYINEDEEVCRQKLEGKRLTRPNTCDPNIWKLMNLCWDDRPNNRPNFQMIHTQLKNIQNIESSVPRSNSKLSSSSINEENSYLFQIEYKTCYDCNLRYTDYDSHLSKCSEQKLTCFKCGNQYRRASFDNHEKNCDESRLDSDEDLSRKSDRSDFDSSTRFNRNVLVPQKRPSISLEASSSPEPVKTPIRSIPVKLPQFNTIQLPCEICKQPIDESQLRVHQVQCLQKDKKRIDDLRMEIERQKTTEEAECKHCKQKYSIKELDNHENTCLSIRKNVPNKLGPLSKNKSTSVPGFLNQNFPSERSTSSNESVKLQTYHDPSKSTGDLTIPKPVLKVVKTEVSTKKNKKQPSRFRKLVSRLWPFNKKKTDK